MVKNLPADAGNVIDGGSISGLEDPLEEAWQPMPEFLPGKSHGQRSLAGLQSMGSQRVEHDRSELAGSRQNGNGDSKSHRLAATGSVRNYFYSITACWRGRRIGWSLRKTALPL